MKKQLNTLFEKLHRYVYDYCYQSTNTDFGRSRYQKANANNKLEPYNDSIVKLYKKISPYFKGWRNNLLNKPKYARYSR